MLREMLCRRIVPNGCCIRLAVLETQSARHDATIWKTRIASTATAPQVRQQHTKGQEIGRLGNSGNTSEAHLHFQLQCSPLLSGENVPWVLDEFTSTGALSPDGDSVIAPPKPGKRTGEVPVAGSISAF